MYVSNVCEHVIHFRTEIAQQKAHSSHALSEFQDSVGISKKLGSKLVTARLFQSLQQKYRRSGNFRC